MASLTPNSVIAVKTKVNDKVVSINFYNWETLPSRLKWLAALKGFAIAPPQDSPVSYDFVPIGNSPNDVQKFMEQLAREDGVDLNIAVNNAFGKV